MASTQQAAPAQQQSTASPAQMHALDNLQAMLNLVFVQSGRYIRELRSGDASARGAFTMKRTIPAAQERFQDSLDELEKELHQSQAVLRRDLAVLQADRLKREQAEAAERQRRAAESSAKRQVPVKPETATPEPKLEPAPTTPVVDTKAEHEDVKMEPPKEIELPPPLDTTADAEAQKDLLVDETPTTANPPDQEFDFDAMFGDIDQSADASGDVNMDTAAPDLTFTLDDSAPSLLPGLEDFAKGGDAVPADAGQADAPLNLDDFTMPDLPDISSTEQPSQLQPQPQPSDPEQEQQQLDTSAPQVQPAAENAADLFDTMMNDDLDDLFNMDPDNPETTEFDNAFFGFDDN